MGQSFSGCGLDEIPLETVQREREAHMINYEAKTTCVIFSCARPNSECEQTLTIHTLCSATVRMRWIG